MARIRAFVGSATFSGWFKTRETVATETPQRRAISLIFISRSRSSMVTVHSRVTDNSGLRIYGGTVAARLAAVLKSAGAAEQ
jgi:hypothetical protein